MNDPRARSASSPSPVGTLETARREDVGLAERLFAGHVPAPAGAEALSVKIGGITMRVAVPPEGFLETLGKRYTPFAWNGPADYELDVARAPDLDLGQYQNIRVRSIPGEDLHYVFRWDFVARLRPKARRASILMAPAGSATCVDTILRMTASFAALFNGGVLLHSAAVATPRGAFVFCGVSRSGKSTVAKISREIGGRTVLTDEMSLVERDGEMGYRLGGTPFWGELGLSVNQQHPLKGILLLAKAPANSIERVPAGEAASELMKTVLCFAQETEICSRLLDTVLAVLSAVPVRRLKFLPDASFWDAVEDHFA